MLFRFRPLIVLLLLLGLALVGCGSGAAPNTGVRVSTPPSPQEPSAEPAPVKPAAAPAPTRQADPKKSVTITAVEYRTADGPWAPIPGAGTLPSADVTLRVHYEGGATPADAEAWLVRQLDKTSGRFAHPAPGLVEVTMARPPARLVLETYRRPFIMFFGSPPQLVAMDPATGAERVVGEAPTNVWDAVASPDGGWVAYSVVENRQGEGTVWLTYTAIGKAERLPVSTGFLESWNTFLWRNGDLIITQDDALVYWSLEHRIGVTAPSAAGEWRSASPDGRYVIGVSFDHNRRKDRYVPATVIVHDLQTRTERVLPNVAHADIRNCWILLDMVWEPGGKAVLIRDHASEKGATLLRLDPTTGAVKPAESGLAFEPRAPRIVAGPTGWSFPDRGWGPIVLQSPAGGTVEHGTGYPIGWTPGGHLLLIRWEHYDSRLFPGGDC